MKHKAPALPRALGESPQRKSVFVAAGKYKSLSDVSYYISLVS